MPTSKSKSIEDTLIEIVGISRQEAAEKGICTFCKQPISDFHDAVSRREYLISGLCQKCQDEVWGGD